jgi:hypothetical protein
MGTLNEGVDMKPNKSLLVLICLIGVVSFSCATAGREINAEQIRQSIQIAKSTKVDVLNICGEPLSKSYAADNDTEMWHYAYIEKNVTPLGVLTHMLGAGTEWKSDKTVVDVYLQKGVVSDLKIETATTVKVNHE